MVSLKNPKVIAVMLIVLALFVGTGLQTITFGKTQMKYESSGQYAEKWVADVNIVAGSEGAVYQFTPDILSSIIPKDDLELKVQAQPATCTYSLVPHNPTSILADMIGLIGGGSFYELTSPALDKKVSFSLSEVDKASGAKTFIDSKTVSATSLNSGAVLTFNEWDADRGSFSILSNGVSMGVFSCPSANEILVWKIASKTYVMSKADFYANLQNLLYCSNPLFYSQCNQGWNYINNPPIPYSWTSIQNLTFTTSAITGQLLGDVVGNFKAYADAGIFDSAYVVVPKLAKPDLLSCGALELGENSGGTLNVAIKNAGEGETPITVTASSTGISVLQPTQTITLAPGASKSLAFAVASGSLVSGVSSMSYPITLSATTASQGAVSSDSLLCYVSVKESVAPTPIPEPTPQPTPAPTNQTCVEKAEAIQCSPLDLACPMMKSVAIMNCQFSDLLAQLGVWALVFVVGVVGGYVIFMGRWR